MPGRGRAWLLSSDLIFKQKINRRIRLRLVKSEINGGRIR